MARKTQDRVSTKQSSEASKDDADPVSHRWQAMGPLSSWEAPNPSPWVRETVEALSQVIIEQPKFGFPKAVVHEDNEFYEYHFSELFVGVQNLATTFFGSGRHQHLSHKRSQWARKYPKEFYEYVQAVAHPDPNCNQWEHLLQRQEQRTMLVSGIIWKALHAHVFDSLLLGADKDHEKLLSSMDENLSGFEAFTQSKVFAETNAAYLKHIPEHIPPQFWFRVDRLTCQILTMLLPLYNACGVGFSDKPPPLEHFVQAVYSIVAYAGWLSVMCEMSPGVLNIIWASPGSRSSSREKMILEDVLQLSEARAKSHGEQRVKIIACPHIIRLSLDDAPSGHHKAYIIQRPHVVYYSGGQGEDQHMDLSDYVDSVRRPRGPPPIWAVVASGCLFFVLLYFLF